MLFSCYGGNERVLKAIKNSSRKKQIDMLTDENNQLKEKLNENSIKNKFSKIVKL